MGGFVLLVILSDRENGDVPVWGEVWEDWGDHGTARVLVQAASGGVGREVEVQ